MERKCCKDCANYYQHYTLNKQKIIRVNCGHCVLHKSKRKQPYGAACDDFVSGEDHEKAFVSKEYLSKELLRYILDLDILPIIEDAEDADI